MSHKSQRPKDPAHAPGHRRLSLDQGGTSPQNANSGRTSRADVFARNEERRNIPGGSIENKGHHVGRTPMGGRGK